MRVLKQVPESDSDRVPVFVYQFRKAILVRGEHLKEVPLQELFEDACRSLAADELALTLKNLDRHRAFYEPQGSSVIQGACSMPPFKDFLSPADYQAD